MEFVSIEFEGGFTIALYDIPQLHINVPGCEPDSFSDGDHDWRAYIFKSDVDSEFLLQFSHYCEARIFILFYVAAGWQPELCVLVIYKQDAAAVYDREVRDQVLRRSCWFAYAEERGA